MSIDDKAIPEVLDALVGRTEPVGDTVKDGEAMENVVGLWRVCEWAAGRLSEAHEHRNDREASVRKLLEEIGGASEGLVETVLDMESRETCTMENRGDYMPSHEFRRWKCSACGGMHWEQANIYLRFRFCPHCGARVDFEAEGGADA